MMSRVLLTMLIVMISFPSFGATRYWIGNSSTNWSDNANWSAALVNGDAPYFTNAGSSGVILNNDKGVWTNAGITFCCGSSGYIINGSATNFLTGNITVTNTHTINFPQAMKGGNQTWTVYRNSVLTNGLIASDGTARSLIKMGLGTLVLTTNNTYTGDTTISQGVLQLGNGGMSGSLSPIGNVINNSQLVFNRSDTITSGVHFDKELGGTGAGVVTISNGVVVFTNHSAFGPNIFNTDGNGTLVLQPSSNYYTFAGLIGAKNFEVTNSTPVFILNVFSFVSNTFSGNLTSRTNLYFLKGGLGTQVLAGTNDWTNGIIDMHDGNLQIGIGGTSGSLNPTCIITNSSLTGSMRFDRSDTITQGVDFGNISGVGSLVHQGSGVMILNSASTYGGATTINRGTLDISGAFGTLGTYAAAITNNGVLKYSSSSNLTISGRIVGSGSLIKTNASLLVLSGTNTYTNTVLSQGTLSFTRTNTLPTTANLYINSTASTNYLNYSGVQTISRLYFDNVQQAAGTWAASGAEHNDATRFSGTGLLNVTSGSSARQLQLSDGRRVVTGDGKFVTVNMP